MDPVVAGYLRRLVAEAESVLGDELVGAYAAGSLALDAFDPGRSDIDVALVCATSLPAGAKQQLVDHVRHEALPCPARGLELVVYEREVARSATPDPAFELELNTGRGMDFRVTTAPDERAAEDGRFWYGLDRDILHAHGLALVGPPAKGLFAALDPEDVRLLLADSLRWWRDRTPPSHAPAPGADDAVLGACRGLLRHRTGAWFGKVAAARRLLADGYGPSALLQRAIDARGGAPPPSGADARDFQEQVLLELTGALR